MAHYTSILCNQFAVKLDFPSKFGGFTIKSPPSTQRSLSQEMLKKQTNKQNKAKHGYLSPCYRVH